MKDYLRCRDVDELSDTADLFLLLKTLTHSCVKEFDELFRTVSFFKSENNIQTLALNSVALNQENEFACIKRFTSAPSVTELNTFSANIVWLGYIFYI